MRDQMNDIGRRAEGGSALLITMVILVLLGIIGLAGLNTVMRDRQSAGFSNRTSLALYAAEAGLAAGQQLVAASTTGGTAPMLPACMAATQVGGAMDFVAGNPTYCGDPRAMDPIEQVGTFQDVASGDNLALQGGRFHNSLWSIRVQGQVPGGGRARVQSVVAQSVYGGYSYND